LFRAIPDDDPMVVEFEPLAGSVFDRMSGRLTDRVLTTEKARAKQT